MQRDKIRGSPLNRQSRTSTPPNHGGARYRADLSIHRSLTIVNPFRNTIIPPIFLGAQSIASESSSSRKKKNCLAFLIAFDFFFFFLLCLCHCFSKKFFKRVESKFNLIKLMDNVRF